MSPEYYEAGVFMPDGFRVRRSMRVHIRQPDDPERTHFQWSMCGNQMRTEQVFRDWITWRRCETKPAPERICTRCLKMLGTRTQTPTGERACCEARSVLNDLLLTRQAHDEADTEELRLVFGDDGSEEDGQRMEEAHNRTIEAELAHEAAWDRARSLLAGEEKT